MICKECTKEFESRRKTAVYCSPACRNKAFRSVAEISVARDKKVSVASKWDKPLEGKTIEGPVWLTDEGYALRLACWCHLDMPEARELAMS